QPRSFYLIHGLFTRSFSTNDLVSSKTFLKFGPSGRQLQPSSGGPNWILTACCAGCRYGHADTEVMVGGLSAKKGRGIHALLPQQIQVTSRWISFHYVLASRT